MKKLLAHHENSISDRLRAAIREAGVSVNRIAKVAQSILSWLLRGERGMKFHCLLFLAFAPLLPAAEAPPKPTIVVFMTHDTGFLDTTPYGSKDARTPNMQRLADAGMTFTRMFVASPSCGPSRTAMLTGLMPARNGAELNHYPKREGIASLPGELQKLGYETAAFGEVAHGRDAAPKHNFERTDHSWSAATVEAFLNKRDASRPLCLFVGTHSSHTPFSPNNGYDPAKVTLPAKFVDTPETRATRTRYLSAVTKADAELGAIYDLIHSRFAPSNTVFVYTTDHGAQWPFGKWNLYDTGTRVPFLAEWPGVIKPGSRSDAMIENTDILPTFIEIAGGTPPKDIDGRSFIQVLRGSTSEHRTEIFTTHSGDNVNVYPIRALRTADFKYILNLVPDKAHTTFIDFGPWISDGWCYFREWVQLAKTDAKAAAIVQAYHKRPAEELYDLRNDPDELHNLATDPQQSTRLTAMRAKLEAWMKAQGDRRAIFRTPHELGEPYPERTDEKPSANSKKKAPKQGE